MISDASSIERVQKAALQVILGPHYSSYRSALESVSLLTLEERRENLCKKFAVKASKNSKHKEWFKVNPKVTITRQKQPFYCPVISRTKRFDKSPISYLTKLLNKK